jgi:uncharacterized protein YdaT
MANQHVVRRSNGQWAVRGEGNTRDTSHHDTQREAFEDAREVAQNQGGDVIIHNRKGRIRERNTYGKKDPRASKG